MKSANPRGALALFGLAARGHAGLLRGEAVPLGHQHLHEVGNEANRTPGPRLQVARISVVGNGAHQLVELLVHLHAAEAPPTQIDESPNDLQVEGVCDDDDSGHARCHEFFQAAVDRLFGRDVLPCCLGADHEIDVAVVCRQIDLPLAGKQCPGELLLDVGRHLEDGFVAGAGLVLMEAERQGDDTVARFVGHATFLSRVD